MDITLHKLDEIRKELIKIRAILEVNRLESKITWMPYYPSYPQPCYPPYPVEPYITYTPTTYKTYSTTNTDPVCNCHEHTPSLSTGGWYCPVHGQRF